MENQEKKEINVLLNKGFDYIIRTRETKGGFLRKAEKEKIIKLEFKEPTLAVLDVVSDKYLQLNITEPKEDDADTSNRLRAVQFTVHDNAAKMAEIIAIFALGENCFNFDGRRYEYDDARVTSLADVIYHNVTPTEMLKIISALTALSNLPNFLSSIRLTGASRTTTAASLVE